MDQRAGFASWAVATKVAEPSTAIDCAGASAVATVLPDGSRIFQLTFAFSACLPALETTVERESVAALPLTAARTVLSHLPRCKASVLVSHTCR